MISSGAALILASRAGKVDEVRSAITAYASTRTSKSAATHHIAYDDAMNAAVEHGHTEVFRMLMAAGADAHHYNERLLRIAARLGHVEIVHAIITDGADVHARNDAALRDAAFHGRAEVVRVLLAAGANVHAENGHALRLAAGSGHIEVIRLLLAAGADVHANHDAALRLAAYQHHVAAARVLLAAKADPNVAWIRSHRDQRCAIATTLDTCADLMTMEQRVKLMSMSALFVGLRSAHNASCRRQKLQRGLLP